MWFLVLPACFLWLPINLRSLLRHGNKLCSPPLANLKRGSDAPAWHLFVHGMESHSPAGAEPGAEGCSCRYSILFCFRGHGCCFCRNVATAIKAKQIKTQQYTRKGGMSNNKSNQTNMLGATLYSMVISLSMNHRKSQWAVPHWDAPNLLPQSQFPQQLPGRNSTQTCAYNLTPQHRSSCCWSCHKSEALSLA